MKTSPFNSYGWKKSFSNWLSFMLAMLNFFMVKKIFIFNARKRGSIKECLIQWIVIGYPVCAKAYVQDPCSFCPSLDTVDDGWRWWLLYQVDGFVLLYQIDGFVRPSTIFRKCRGKVWRLDGDCSKGWYLSLAEMQPDVTLALGLVFQKEGPTSSIF